MTKYREIIRLAGLNLSQTNIALSCNASKTTVNKVLKAAREQNLVWPLDPKLSDPVLGKLLFPEVKAKPATSKRMPDFEHVRKELLRNGVNKKLLWTEYLEECRLSKEEPLMYSRFCSSSRMSRSAAPLCISTASPRSRLRSTGQVILRTSSIQISVKFWMPRFS